MTSAALLSPTSRQRGLPNNWVLESDALSIRERLMKPSASNAKRKSRQSDRIKSPRYFRDCATLLKPYTFAEMLRTVKRVLREADSTADGSQLFMYGDMKDNKISQAGEPGSAPLQCETNPPHRTLVVTGMQRRIEVRNPC